MISKKRLSLQWKCLILSKKNNDFIEEKRNDDTLNNNNNKIITVSNISASITDSQISELIPACRSIDTLLSLVPCFVLDHTKYDDDDKIGLKCTACDVLYCVKIWVKMEHF